MHDSLINSPNASADDCVRGRVTHLLSRVPAILEEVHPPVGDIDGGLFIHLPHHSSILGSDPTLEVIVHLFRIIRFRVFPNDYEKVMKNVKRKLIEKKILKSSIETVDEDTR